MATELADHSSSIMNLNRSLERSDIPSSINKGPNHTRLVTKEQVEAKLKTF